ncbi:MAG TPA: NUDIX domain-containing protein [Ktedonobacterales bacterium]|nr:NUDIX domain-containing protein [Ktedonobacterales bacterium]
MQHADVVTNFLLRHSPAGRDEILIVRRSSRVGTYHGRWAGVSGFVEAPPDEQAYVELSEETHLGREDVTLLRKGEPLTFVDAALDREWTVHPYLFLVADPAKIQTDWEATEARWIAPEDLDHYETVPMLKEALQRVYPSDAPDAQPSSSAGA